MLEYKTSEIKTPYFSFLVFPKKKIKNSRMEIIFNIPVCCKWQLRMLRKLKVFFSLTYYN